MHSLVSDGLEDYIPLMVIFSTQKLKPSTICYGNVGCFSALPFSVNTDVCRVRVLHTVKRSFIRQNSKCTEMRLVAGYARTRGGLTTLPRLD